MKKQLIASLLALSFSSVTFAQDDVKPFTMEGELGIIATTGNTETSSISAGITAHQELEQWSNDYILEGLYKKETVDNDDGTEEEYTSAQKFYGSAQGNYKLDNPDYRLFGFASYEDDRLSNFDYQSTLTVGWNQKVLQTNAEIGYVVVDVQQDRAYDALAQLQQIDGTIKTRILH